MTLTRTVTKVFHDKFGTEPLLAIAPGRINLIGEHTDYNSGFVMPAAVDKCIAFAVASNDSDQCHFYSVDFKTSFSFKLSELTPGGSWFHYLMGVADGFLKMGLPISGIDCVFGGNIPTGAGMSSSAALCCGIAYAFNELFDLKLSRLQLAKLAQQAEHEFAGVRCGIMDQYASLFGEANSALLLDCRSLTHEILPLNFVDTEILLIDTKVKHELGSSAYNDRRAACEAGVHELQKTKPTIQSLRDVSKEDLVVLKTKVHADVFVKCRFIVNEINRTQQAAQLLKANDLVGFGKKMFETHWGLSKEYEVSCAESDLLVQLAQDSQDAVLGARQMGGGFGGCTINLIRKRAIKPYKDYIKKKYVASFKKEPDFYSVDLVEGVHAIKPLPNS